MNLAFIKNHQQKMNSFSPVTSRSTYSQSCSKVLGGTYTCSDRLSLSPQGERAIEIDQRYTKDHESLKMERSSSVSTERTVGDLQEDGTLKMTGGGVKEEGFWEKIYFPDRIEERNQSTQKR